MPDSTEAAPFARAAHLYRSAGWEGTIPLGRAPGMKFPPPSAFTGHGKPMPSGADVAAWLEGPEGGRNIGLRLPPGVIGIDVDAYGSKRGADELARLTALCGELPATWMTSARTDGVSGIRFYRVPLELDGRPINWAGEAGKNIEIVQNGHRYACVWPSTNPDADGATYQWRHPDAAPGGHSIPRVDDLPWLPETWIRKLSLGYDRGEKADLSGSAAGEWLAALRPGPPCSVVTTVTQRAVAELRQVDGSRHETARDRSAAVARLGGEGHAGVRDALDAIGAAFIAAVGRERGVDGGEWRRLLHGAVKLAAGANPRPLARCAHDAPESLAGVAAPEGFGVPAPPAGAPLEPAETAAAPPTPADGALTLPEEFWGARESLARIRQAAHSRVRSGDVVFYGLLVRLAAMAPHTLRADTGIGSAASLNLFTAIVGPSGGGKSSGLSVSRDLVAGAQVEEYPLGSGEGIAEAFMGEAEEETGEMARDGSAKTRRVRKQVRHNALFHSDEGNTLVKLIERAGSTVGETLRSAWSGESIGQKNGRVETTRTIPSRAYAAGLAIGFQPSTVLPLLGDVDAGTPQRFLFCWAVDPSIPPRSARVQWPGTMPNPFPAHVPTDAPPPGAVVAVPPGAGASAVTFADEILDELYEIEHAKNTGSLPQDHPLRDPFRSQHPVLRVKIAALLALLDGRRAVAGEDWRLAQIVIDTSDRVREHLQALERHAAGKARAAALAAEAETEAHRAHARAQVSASLDASAERRVAMRIASWIHDGAPMTLGALRKRATSGDRPRIEAAVELGREYGWLVVGDDARVHPGPSRPGAAPG